MSRLEIAGVQFDIAWENPAENFSRAGALVKRAVADGARLVVLPEMFATGFSMDAGKVAPHADSIAEWVSNTARDTGAWLLAGFACPGAEKPLNAAAVFDPDGREVLRYHKIHPFSLAGEHEHYAGGRAMGSIAIDGVRITPIICYDLRFPEIFRLRAADTDVFAVIANWPEARRLHWSALLRARAIESQVWVLGVNRVGEGNGLNYSGDSALIDPLGEICAERVRQTGLIRGTVDAGMVADVRRRFSFLADRRPDVYAAL